MNPKEIIDNIHNLENQNENIISKTEMNIPSYSKSKKYQYFPIESEKTKNGGNIIYLVAEDENKNENNDIQIKTNINYSYKNSSGRIKASKKVPKIIRYNDNNLIYQRSIELKIDKTKINNIINGSIEEKNISENNDTQKNYKNNNITINKDKLDNIIDKNKNKNISQFKNKYGKNYFNMLNIKNINMKQIQKMAKSNQLSNSINTLNKNSNFIYKKKKEENHIPSKENGILNKNITNKEDNNKNDIQISRNDILEMKIQNTFPELKNDDIYEFKKESISNNDSLLEPITKSIKNYSQLNHSFEIKDNINSFYKSLSFCKNNLDEDLNNSKIMEKTFLSGIKNEQRKNSLKNALSIYNRFKNKNKLNNDTNKKENGKNENEIKLNENKIINNTNNNTNNNEEDKEEQNLKQEKNNINNEEDDNEKDFSFNAKINNNNSEKNSENNNESNNIYEIQKENDIINENKKEKDDMIDVDKNNENENIGNIENDEKKDVNKIKENNIIDENENMIDNDKNNENNGNIENDEDDNKIIEDNVIDKNEKGKEKEKENENNNPSYFIRKVIREEHYYIDEDGNEKILEVKQKYINNEDEDEYENKEEEKKQENVKDKDKDEYEYEDEENKQVNIKNEDEDEDKNEFEEKNLTFKAPYVRKNFNFKNTINLNSNNIKNKETKIEIINTNKRKNIYGSSINDLNTINNKSIYNKRNNIIHLTKNNIKDYKNSNIKGQTPKNYIKHISNNSSKLDDDKKIVSNNVSKLVYDYFNNADSNKRHSVHNKYVTKKNDYIKPSNTAIHKKYIYNSNNNNKNNTIFKKDIFNVKKDKKLSINTSKEDLSNYKNKNMNNINTNLYKRNENKSHYINSYIKVNKVDKPKKVNTENNNNYSYINRGFDSNHTFHEIKSSKPKIISNSESNFFSSEFSTDELNSSNYTNPIHKYSKKSINSEKNNKPTLLNQNPVNKNSNLNKIVNINININKSKHDNFANKSNSDSYYLINMRKSYKSINNNDKTNHQYYESKSSKKKGDDSSLETDRNHPRRFTNYSSSYLGNSINTISKDNKKEKYFYQNYNF